MLMDVRPLNANSYQNLISSGVGAGKLYVNVEPNMVLYTQYKHISGVAAQKTQHPISVSKVQILNALIERLSKLKNQDYEIEIPGKLDEDQIDILIDDLQNKITAALELAQANPFAQGIGGDLGQLVNLVA
jgi:hypothetical protein